MIGMPSILSLFRKEFNTFNKYRSMNVRFYLSNDSKTTLISYFLCKNTTILPYICDVITDVNMLCCKNLYTTSGLSILLHAVISLLNMTLCDN